MAKKTLIIAPHPDDETLGCGGTILRRKNEGAEVAWLIVTSISEEGGWSSDRVLSRDEEITEVQKRYSFDEVFNLGYPSIELDNISIRDLVDSFSNIINDYKPNEIFAPHRGDVHSDHRVVFDAVMACSKWFRYPSLTTFYSYETASETEFNLYKGTSFDPNIYIDISDFIEEKLEILKIYKSELGEHPFPRSIESVKALSLWRGSNSGYRHAEAFELLMHRE